MLTTITIFIIALHMSVTFPAGLTTETKLWSLGGFAFLALVSLLSAFIQAVKGRDMTLLQKMLLMKAIGFMITFSYDFLEDDKTAMITAIRSSGRSADLPAACQTLRTRNTWLLSQYLRYPCIQPVYGPDAVCNCRCILRHADCQLS